MQQQMLLRHRSHIGMPPTCVCTSAAAQRPMWGPQQCHAQQRKRTKAAAGADAGSSSGGASSSNGGSASEGGSSSSSSSSSRRRPIEISRSIAAARAAESSRPDSLIHDPFAELLAEGRRPDGAESALDVLATRYIDECLMNAIDQVNINSINEGEYRQVVLVGDGFDARPFRLPWPPGTVLFLAAPPESHERAEAILHALPGGPPAVERGRLLRRVSINLPPAAARAEAAPAAAEARTGSGAGAAGVAAPAAVPEAGGASTILTSQMERAGFRQDRLSLWALQGLHGQGLDAGALAEVLAEVADCAAFHSLVVGELPLAGGRRYAEDALAEAGLLGAAYGHSSPEVGGGRGRLQEGAAAKVEAEAGAGGRKSERWLFASQQMRLSLAQMGIYERHVEAAEEADEDFMGHFS